MAENRKIEWTDHTFNPWIGCTKVSPGCANCYAEELMDKRYGRVQWGPQGTRKRTSAANWRKPLAWNRKAAQEGRRYRVFCASLADVFEDRPELYGWRYDLLHLIEQTPNLDWLLLTKRPENIGYLVGYAHGPHGHAWDGGLPPNVWIGTSVENQEQADRRIPELLKMPAKVRFLSMEPLLGPVDFRKVPGFNRMGLDLSGWWVIVGGESGPNARPMHPNWARSIRDQCRAAGVLFFFKQWGEWLPVGKALPAGAYAWPGDDLNVIESHRHMFLNADGSTEDCTDCGRRGMSRVGKKAAGRLLDGREWNEHPQP